jgi:hypothetical protein
LGTVIDPDAIARERTPDDPSKCAIFAARTVLTALADGLERGSRMVYETTLWDKNRHLELIAQASGLPAIRGERQHECHSGVEIIVRCPTASAVVIGLPAFLEFRSFEFPAFIGVFPHARDFSFLGCLGFELVREAHHRVQDGFGGLAFIRQRSNVDAAAIQLFSQELEE